VCLIISHYTGFGIDRQYPKEISLARSELYNSEEAKLARARRQKVQIHFPAKLVIDRKIVRDMFPDWFKVLGTDRLRNIQLNAQCDKLQHNRVYSNSTVADDEHQQQQINSDTEVFEYINGHAHQNVNNSGSKGDNQENVQNRENTCTSANVKNDSLPIMLSNSESSSEESSTRKQNKSRNKSNQKKSHASENPNIHVDVNSAKNNVNTGNRNWGNEKRLVINGRTNESTHANIGKPADKNRHVNTRSNDSSANENEGHVRK
jgi:hypothetical protein